MNTVIKIFTKESFIIPLISIILGLLFGAVVMLLGGYDPIAAYSALITYIFRDRYYIGEAIREITPLIFTGLAVAFAFRTGLFNIGVEGQLIMGMTGATIVGVGVSLPWFLHAPLAIIVGVLFGGLWGAIAGFLKASRGVNEVITTIMLNWIALYFGNYIIRTWFLEPGTNRSYFIKESASIKIGWLTEFFQNARIDLGIFFAVICAIIFYIILWKTKQGYELRAVGFNHHAAEYAGINVNRNMMKAMLISGMFAGLAGVVLSLGVYEHQIIAAGYTGYGFDGIAVALLGGNGAIGVMLAAILFGSLKFGGSGMFFNIGVPDEIISIVIAAVIFFVAAHGIIKWIIKPFMGKKKDKGAVS